jgi:predicted membrane protein
METNKTQPHEEMWQQWEKEHKRGKIIGGSIVVIAGALFLAKELGVSFPEWLFTWKTLLITIGLAIGLKHNFRNSKGMILILIGGLFLLPDLLPQFAIKPLLWPIMIIVIGLFIIFKPRKKIKHKHWERWEKRRMGRHACQDYENVKTETNNEDIVDFTSFMGEIKKNIISKTFKRGDVTVVFAGTELNFSQADFIEKAELDLTAVFGAVQLIVPANWDIKSEVVCAFGSVDDKRMVQPSTSSESKKVITLKGNVFFGGIEIKNF